MKKHIFISKNEDEIRLFLNRFHSKEFDIITHSFLSFSPIDFEVKSNFDIIFFSSPRSVTFYKTKHSIPNYVKLGCVGTKTKELLIKMGYTVDFTRKEGQPLNDFALSFKEWCRERKVLFPISSISLKTISSKFPQGQIEELEVYSTKIVGKIIEECDVYVFTSPSNVEGFLEKNTIPDNARIISWGESTSRFLLENGDRVDVELKNSCVEELLSVL